MRKMQVYLATLKQQFSYSYCYPKKGIKFRIFISFFFYVTSVACEIKCLWGKSVKSTISNLFAINNNAVQCCVVTMVTHEFQLLCPIGLTKLWYIRWIIHDSFYFAIFWSRKQKVALCIFLKLLAMISGLTPYYLVLVTRVHGSWHRNDIKQCACKKK